MTEETENTENIDELAKYRPSKEELEKIMKEEAEKEEQDIKRLIKRSELREKEKETGIILLEEEEEEKEEKGRPPKGKIAGTIFDMRFPPLEDSAGFCNEHGKEIIVRYNKESRRWEPYIGATKILGKPVERFRG